MESLRDDIKVEYELIPEVIGFRIARRIGSHRLK